MGFGGIRRGFVVATNSGSCLLREVEESRSTESVTCDFSVSAHQPIDQKAYHSGCMRPALRLGLAFVGPRRLCGGFGGIRMGFVGAL